MAGHSKKSWPWRSASRIHQKFHTNVTLSPAPDPRMVDAGRRTSGHVYAIASVAQADSTSPARAARQMLTKVAAR
jgi:hypothetical protein